MLLEPAEIQALVLSVKVAVICTLTIFPIAVLMAYVLAKREFKGKIILEGMLNLPMVMPPVTTGFLLLVIFGANGFIGKILYQAFDIKIAFTLTACVLASAVVSSPLVIRSAKAAFEMIDPELLSASKTLGKNNRTTFLKITLPLALPGILNGMVLGFARCLGEFGATITFAGNISGKTQTLPLAVYQYIQTPGKEASATRLVVISILISFAALALSEYILKRRKA